MAYLEATLNYLESMEKNKRLTFDSPVYPIPPSFAKERLELKSTRKYLKYLKEGGCKHVMTTAGTSQFNLLSLSEIRSLNKQVSKFDGNKIIGLPALSLPHLKEEINKLNKWEIQNAYLLIIFPERFYNNDQFIDFFNEVADHSSYPILAHTTPVRMGKGGTYSYSLELLKELSQIPNFIGIKEESPSLDYAINEIQNLNMEIIVAGGSMKRFWALSPFGATTYLSGLGSLFPQHEENFFNLFAEGNLYSAKRIITEIETPFFNTSMKVGWHASMRFGLKQLGFLKENRAPFIELGEDEKDRIIDSLSLISNA